MAKKKEGMTRHHCIPLSRGGGNSKKVLVEANLHRLYSQLFKTSNHKFKTIEMLPEEIVEFLNDTFWDNGYEIEIRRKGKK